MKKRSQDATNGKRISISRIKPKVLILIVEKIRKNEIDCSHLVNNLLFFVIVTDIYYQLLDFFADF